MHCFQGSREHRGGGGGGGGSVLKLFPGLMIIIIEQVIAFRAIEGTL